MNTYKRDRKLLIVSGITTNLFKDELNESTSKRVDLRHHVSVFRVDIRLNYLVFV